MLKRTLVLSAAIASVATSVSLAAPYPSNVIVAGTNVSFILNEGGSTLTYSVNGGLPQLLDGTAKGAKTFTLGSPTDTFSITATKTDTVGYQIPTGATTVASANGLSQTTANSGFRLISDDSNPLNRFNSPRGVGISNNPNSGTFGTAYVSNSAAGSTTGVVRTVGDGLYAVRADQTDAFGYLNTASDPGNLFDGVAASPNSPFRVTVSGAGEIYVADFSDANGNIYRNNANLTVGTAMFSITGGPSPVPAGQNHGSTTAVYVEGSSATGNLVIYTLDEDLTSSNVGGTSTTDRNSLWRYDIGSGATPSSVAPTKVNVSNLLVPQATSDLDRGLIDGKFYLGQTRATSSESGLVVLNSDGTTAFDSLVASRTLLANPTANDILRQVTAIDVSDDQQFLAVLLNNSDLTVIPLVNGIPT